MRLPGTGNAADNPPRSPAADPPRTPRARRATDCRRAQAIPLGYPRAGRERRCGRMGNADAAAAETVARDRVEHVTAWRQ